MITTLAADHDIAGLYLFGKAYVNVDHAVGGQFLGIKGIEVAGGNNNVGVDVVAILENSALSSHFHMCSFRRSDERRRGRRCERAGHRIFARLAELAY